MKDILVEFTDYGAIIHKDPSVISSKKDLPFCFFNPNLSKVSGVSPSYWVYSSDNEIVPASPEEKKRRDEYHKGKPSENTVSLKQTIDLMRQEICDDIQEDINVIQEKIKNLESFDQQTVNTFSYKLVDIKNEMDSNKKIVESMNDTFLKIIQNQEVKIKQLKIGLITTISIIGIISVMIIFIK